MPVSPAALEWRLTTAGGEAVVPEQVSVDFRDTDDQASGPINFLLHPEAARMMVAHGGST